MIPRSQYPNLPAANETKPYAHCIKYATSHQPLLKSDHGTLGLLAFVQAWCEFFTTLVVVILICSQQRKARRANQITLDSEAALGGSPTRSRSASNQSQAAILSMDEAREVSSVLVLPVYWWILCLTLLCAAGHSVKLMVLGYDSGQTYGITYVSALEGLCWGCGHAIYEGCALLLCQRGAGTRGFRWAISLGVSWGLVTSVVVAIHYSNWCRGGVLTCEHQKWSFYLMLAWEWLVLGFYSSLWFLPSRCLYRRPALHDYAAYQTVTRSLMVASLLMVWYRVDMGFCMELFGDTVLAGIGTPIMLFRALFQAHQPIPTSQLPPSPSTSTSTSNPKTNTQCGFLWQDSAFWQGKLIPAGKSRGCFGSARRVSEPVGAVVAGAAQGLESVLVEGRFEGDQGIPPPSLPFLRLNRGPGPTLTRTPTLLAFEPWPWPRGRGPPDGPGVGHVAGRHGGA